MSNAAAVKRIVSKDMKSIQKNNLHENGIFIEFNENDVTILKDKLKIGDGYGLQGSTFYKNGNISTDGNILATDVVSVSDKQLKKNIKTIKSPINKLKNIKGVSFNWKNNNESSFGVIAQDIEKILPKAVNKDNKGIK